MLVMGFVGQSVTDWVPRRCLRSFRVRFSGMTRPGDTITVAGRVRGKRRENGENLIFCEVVACDDHGGVKMQGSFSAALPVKQG
jgi:acyl dehydratase